MLRTNRRQAKRSPARERSRPVNSFEYIQSVLHRLRIVKGGMTYSQMETDSGIHSTLLCRYVTGNIRPSKGQAKLLERTLLRNDWFRTKLKEKMIVTQNGYLDLHQVTGDPNALRWISAEAASQFSDLKCDRIVTAATSGIPLATAIAIEMQLPVAYATYSKTSGAVAYYEADLSSRNPSEISTLYLPRNLVGKGDLILIVDDVATSGRTLSGLIDLVRQSSCRLSGIFVLASRSNNWKERITPSIDGTKVSVLFDLNRGD